MSGADDARDAHGTRGESGRVRGPEYARRVNAAAELLAAGTSVAETRILFGSDFPYAPAPVAAKFTEILDNQTGPTEAQKAAFNNGNGKMLFKRLA